ncbi:MAG TPA: HEPN domain-containing protein [Methylocystis sp.]|nr:HEPN domain-containing protein [Methylocystis sp.]
MTRAELRAIAEAKLEDAHLLLEAGRHANAYYLCGYAVEIGLKACIAAQIAPETLPGKDFVKGILNHQFAGLAALAGLGAALRAAEDADRVFAVNWATALDWSPDSRYRMTDPQAAEALFVAVTDPSSGVMRWIKAHW